VTDTHHLTERSFVDEFRLVSPHHYLNNGWQNAVLLWCVLQAKPPSLYYYCSFVLHSCIVLPPVGHSSNHEYHCCQLTRQSNCVSNFYRTFKVFIWLSLVCVYMCVCVCVCAFALMWCRNFFSWSVQTQSWRASVISVSIREINLVSLNKSVGLC